MIEVTPTAPERVAERFEEAALQRAVAALQEDGLVVIDDVVDHTHLDRLQERMNEDLVKIRALPVVPHNFVWGNIQQNPPPDADLVFRDVVANPFVCQVTRALLGSGAFNECLTGNTNVPGSGLQPVHVDEGQLWPNLGAAHPPARLVVNIALSETTEQNGAIELWPGTHLDTRMVIGNNIRVPEEHGRRAASGAWAGPGVYPQGGGADSGHAAVASRHAQPQRRAPVHDRHDPQRGVVSAPWPVPTGAGVCAGVRRLRHRERDSPGGRPEGSPGRQRPVRLLRAQLNAERGDAQFSSSRAREKLRTNLRMK